MKKLKLLLFILPFLFISNVFATSKNVINYIQYDVDNPTGTYKGDEIYNGGYNGKFDVKTRYNGRLSLIEFYLSTDNFNFEKNTTYTITLNMATNDWRNNFMGPQVREANLNGSLQSSSLTVSNFQFVSRKTIKFNFKTDGSISPYLFFRLYSSNYATSNTIAITGDTNWNLSSIVISDNVSSGGSSSGGSSSGGSSSGGSSSITCNNGLVVSASTYNYSNVDISSKYLNSSGEQVSHSSFGIVSYIPISPNSIYYLTRNISTSSTTNYCLYTSSKSLISCSQYNSATSFTINTGNAHYISLSVRDDYILDLGTCLSPLENENQNTQNIIENENQNTTNIIENNNDNTQQIIDNQNQNTQNVVNSQSCPVGPYDLNKLKNGANNLYLDGNGETHVNNDYAISPLFSIIPNTAYTFNIGVDASNPSVCFYQRSGGLANSGVGLISCIRYAGRRNITFTSPANAYYMKVSYHKGHFAELSGNVCNDFATDAIVENQNQNTQDILAGISGSVAAQSQNTQDIINNQNENAQNTQDTIKDNLNTCIDLTPIYKTSFNGLLTVVSSSPNILRLESNSTYLIYVYEVSKLNEDYTFVFNNYNRLRVASSDTYYTSVSSATSLTKVLVDDSPSVSSTYTITPTKKYLYFYLSSSSSVPGSVSFQAKEECKNKLDSLNDSINDTNSYLKDDSDPTIDDSVLNDVFGRVHFTDPLSYLLTLPTQLINKIVSLSDSCSAIDFGTLYGVHLTMPCINLENYLGSDLWNLLDVILSVGLLAVILKNFYDTISNLLTLGGQKEAKEKFSLPTPMDFLAMILGGDNR